MRIFTLVYWTFGFLVMPARTKDEIRLNMSKQKISLRKIILFRHFVNTGNLLLSEETVRNE